MGRMQSQSIILIIAILLAGCGNGNYCCDFYGNCDPFCAAKSPNEAKAKAAASSYSASSYSASSYSASSYSASSYSASSYSVEIDLSRTSSTCAFAPKNFSGRATFSSDESQVFLKVGRYGRLKGRKRSGPLNLRGTLGAAGTPCTATGAIQLSGTPSRGVTRRVVASGSVVCGGQTLCGVRYEGTVTR